MNRRTYSRNPYHAFVTLAASRLLDSLQVCLIMYAVHSYTSSTYIIDTRILAVVGSHLQR